MKLISKIVLLCIFIYVLFLYRTELRDIVDGFTASNKSTIENASWAGLRKKAYDAYEFKDTEVAITIIEEYLATVQQELQRHEHKREDQNLATTRHDVECELSVIHDKLRHKYYQMSDTDKQYYHEMLYREYLSKCVNPDENET